MQKTTKNCNKLQVSNNQFPNTTSNQNPPYWFIQKKKKTLNLQNPNPKSNLSKNPYQDFIQYRESMTQNKNFKKKKKKKLQTRLESPRSLHKMNASDGSNPHSDITVSSNPT